MAASGDGASPAFTNVEGNTKTLRTIAWHNSIECHRVIQILLALQANQTPAHSQLRKVLADKLPLFFMPTLEETFFGALEDDVICDFELRSAIIDFLARWGKDYYATYEDMCADSSVREKLNVVLPKRIPLWIWMRKRLFPDIELWNESGVWIIRISPGRWRIQSELLGRWKLLTTPTE